MTEGSNFSFSLPGEIRFTYTLIAFLGIRENLFCLIPFVPPGININY